MAGVWLIRLTRRRPKTLSEQSAAFSGAVDTNRYLRINSAKVNANLSKFIHVRVDDLSRKGGYSNILKEKVLDALTRNAGVTFC
jgi:hypothetical protein